MTTIKLLFTITDYPLALFYNFGYKLPNYPSTEENVKPY